MTTRVGDPRPLSRRRLLQLLSSIPLVAACLPRRESAPASPIATEARTAAAAPAAAPATGAPALTLAPTPECREPGQATVAQTEGPFFKPSTPRRTSLVEPGMTGTRLVVTGMVLTRACRPIAGALLDFWQADAAGEYDNAGFRLRGHQLADQAGRYRLETIVPAQYAGRTPHIHVKAQAPNRPVLTTQLYFPDEPRNATDGIFRRELVMTVQKQPTAWTAAFDFVLDVP